MAEVQKMKWTDTTAKVTSLLDPSTETPTRYATVDEGQHADDEEIHQHNFPWHLLIPESSWFCRPWKEEERLPGVHIWVCLEHEEDETGNKYRCLNQFTINSTQCKDHPKILFKEGPNQIWTEMKAGRVGNWGMLKKPLTELGQVPVALERCDEVPCDEIEAVVDECVTAGEDRGVAWNTTVAEYEKRKALAKKMKDNMHLNRCARQRKLRRT
ncbi:hypothetical protein DE146DRAFT_634980 [Phaeosphaeria sp. MPI-PUGE-AT-0046c]|nr:hypothetical protein DE146DRAFT_634980 [Phaeosphaeria sp. MPI-PUGE-AT-0046c]